MRYEGEWRDGQEHGVGTLVEPDGSAYYGFWARGKLHGEGVQLSSHLPAASQDWTSVAIFRRLSF